MSDALTPEAVLKVARLSRLRLPEEKVRRFQTTLTAVLSYIEQIGELGDLSGVEPMAHPSEMTDRLDEDEPGPMLTVEQVLRNAPETRDAFIVVPKVLGSDDAGGGG